MRGPRDKEKGIKRERKGPTRASSAIRLSRLHVYVWRAHVHTCVKASVCVCRSTQRIMSLLYVNRIPVCAASRGSPSLSKIARAILSFSFDLSLSFSPTISRPLAYIFAASHSLSFARYSERRCPRGPTRFCGSSPERKREKQIIIMLSPVFVWRAVESLD